MSLSAEPSLPPLPALLSCVAGLGSVLDDTSGLSATLLSATQKQTALLELTRVVARTEELRLRVLAAAQDAGHDVAQGDGARDTAAWLAHHARLDPARARHLGRLAGALEGLDGPHVAVGAALRGGVVDLAQADVIVRAMAKLPEDLDPDIHRQGEQRLLAEAQRFDPRHLRILGRRILEVVAPEIAEAEQARQLADEEAHAHAVTLLKIRRRGDGTTDLHARLADTVVHRLLTYLHAYTSPRQPQPRPPQPRQSQPRPSQPRPRPSTGSTGEASDPGTASSPGSPGSSPGGLGSTGSTGSTGNGDRRPYDQRLGHALGTLLESLDPDRLPLHGGDATTIIVTIALDDLTERLDTADTAGTAGPAGTAGVVGVALVGDEPLTAAQARRLACTAQILPAVLGADSRVLDLARTRRLFTPTQRKALALRHPTCAATGCTIPAPWCEAHHATTAWAAGGTTNLDDGTLLCSHHHHTAHDPRYDTTHHPDGTIHFHRRQ